MWRTPATLRGTLDDVPDATRAPARFDPRARDELRRHLRGRRHARRRGALATSSPRRACTTATAASCRRSRRGTTSSWSTPSSTTRWHGRARRSTTSSLVAVTQGPGLVGALLVGVATAKALAAARRLPLAPVDHLQGHVAANYLAPRADRAAVPVPARLGRPHAARPRRPSRAATRCSGATLDDAAGEAFDKGARLLGLRYPGRPGALEAGARGRPAGVRLPARAAGRRARLLVRRPQDRAALRGARPGGGGDRAPRAPTSRRPTSTRSSRR